MKKLLYLSMLMFVFGACTDSLTDLNVNEKEPEVVPAGALVANSTVAMFDMMTSTNVNVNNFRLWSQQWAQTTYPDESNYQLVERNVNGRTWNTVYATVLRDLREAKPLIQADQFLTTDEKAAQGAIISVMEVYAYAVMVDIFGNVPYSDAFGELVTPSYDDDEAIYNTIIDQLDDAISNLSGSSALGSNDLVYGGDTGAWRKFANSLKLRMAIRLADSNDSKAKAMAEAAVADGVFDSSADNFQLAYPGGPPHANPLWDDLVQSGRSDFIAANTLGDYMNSLNDPRRSVYFSDLDADGNVMGGIYGASNNYADFSHAGTAQLDPTLPGVIMDYTEVRFLLADAAERGYNVGGTAEEHYNAGVMESMAAWGVDATAAADYLAQESVGYTTAAGNWKEKIAMQKWLALYNRGFEAWTTYRIYDAPVMNIADGAQTTPPFRYTYPTSEFSLNGDNVRAAGSAMGGDDLFSKVFWDVN